MLNPQKISVLLVEDENEIRGLLRWAITCIRGTTVTSVSNAEQAMEIIKSGQDFDVIVTDVVMQGMGGKGLVEALRAKGSPHKKETPIIVVSARANRDSVIQMKDLGIYAWFVKPILPEPLQRAICQAAAKM